MLIAAGSTSVSIPIYCRTTGGAAVTGKVAADFSLSYRRDAGSVALSLVNLAAIDSEHTPGGIIEVGDCEYRLDLPDAAVAAGALQMSVTGTVAGGELLPYPIAID